MVLINCNLARVSGNQKTISGWLSGSCDIMQSLFLLLLKLQPQQQGARARQSPTAANRQPSSTPNHQPAAAQPETEEPPSPTSSISSSQHQMEVAEEEAPSQVPEAAPPAAALSAPKANSTPEISSQSVPTEPDAMQTEAESSSTANENANPPPKDTVMEQTLRGTRGRLRKTRSAGNR